MALATLNGHSVLAAHVSIPAWGVWTADVEIGSTEALTGAVTLVIDDLTLRGTIMSGGAYQTRGRYRIAGGAGGWGRPIPAKAYANDLGVRLSRVLADAAEACGETLGTVATTTVGTAFLRAEGPAARVLHELSPQAWYVDEAGVTQVGRRPAVTYTGTAPRITTDLARGMIELAPASLAGLVPGAVVDGLEAVDVEIALEGALRVTIYGRGIADTARLPSALTRIVEGITAGHRFYGSWEYRVVARTGERLQLQVVRASSGMPDLFYAPVPVRAVAGVRVRPALGSTVLVSFVDGDPSKPYVAAFTAPTDVDAGFIPDELALMAGSTGSSPTEHATSAEALIVAVQTVLATVGAALTTAGSPAGAALTALVVDATFSTGLLATLAAGALGPSTQAALLAALAAKTADTSGASPGLGWPAVRGG